MKKIGSLGNLGDKVTVRSGYGRNYLIPKGFAVLATADNLAAFEERRADLERQAIEALAGAELRREQLDGLTVTIARKAGDEGRLFGSVGIRDICEAVEDMGLRLERSEVRLPDGPLRTAGRHEVGIHLHADIDAELRVDVVPED